MFSFEPTALLTLLLVIVLDSLLSVDNALVLAIMVEHLPPEQANRALRYGILGAYLMRGLSLFFVSFLVSFWPLKLAGAAYLIWLGVSSLLGKGDDDPTRQMRKPSSFWLTVLQVEWLDLTFSLDNILATVALAPNNILIVFIGVCVSIVAMRFVAGVFLKLLDRYPALHSAAYVMIVFVGLKLILDLIGIEVSELVTFAVILGILAAALLYDHRRAAGAIEGGMSARRAASQAGFAGGSGLVDPKGMQEQTQIKPGRKRIE